MPRDGLVGKFTTITWSGRRSHCGHLETLESAGSHIRWAPPVHSAPMYLCTTSPAIHFDGDLKRAVGDPTGEWKKRRQQKKNHTMVHCKYSTVETHEWAPRAWPSTGSVPNMEAERDGKWADYFKRRQVVHNSSGWIRGPEHIQEAPTSSGWGLECTPCSAPRQEAAASHLISDLLFVFPFTFTIRMRGDQREPAEVRPPRTAPLGSEGMTASLQHRDPVAAVPPHPLISSPPLGSELPESDPATLPIHFSSVAPTQPCCRLKLPDLPRFRNGSAASWWPWRFRRCVGAFEGGGRGINNGNPASFFKKNSQRCLHSRAAGGGRWGHSGHITQVAFTPPSSSSSSSSAPPSGAASDGKESRVLPAERGGSFRAWSAAALSPLINPRVCPPTLQRRRAARAIHRVPFPSPGLPLLGFSVGLCGGCGAGGGGRTEKRTSSPHRAASSATQRQRTAEQIRRQAPRCHARTPTTVLRMCARTLVKGALLRLAFYFLKSTSWARSTVEGGNKLEEG